MRSKSCSDNKSLGKILVWHEGYNKRDEIVATKTKTNTQLGQTQGNNTQREGKKIRMNECEMDESFPFSLSCTRPQFAFDRD